MSARTPEPSVRPGLPESVQLLETRHTIADSLVYLVPDFLENLRGPASGPMDLPIHLDWGPDRRYDVDYDTSCAALYALTLQTSGSLDEMCSIVNRGRLMELWPTMQLPDRCRQPWEAAFPKLPNRRAASEHPSWSILNERQ